MQRARTYRRSTLNWLALAAFAFGVHAAAADFGTKGGPEPANTEAIAELLRQDPYDMELLISFGTSKGGSAGHLALAIRHEGSPDDTVYSANFYADRSPHHEEAFYTADLMVRIPKKEYLFGTVSSLDEKASFGLDFGEIYKRSVVGVRVYGVPPGEKQALARYFERINDDYRNRARRTEYHDGEIRYDYTHLNCAKTIGVAFKYGAGYAALDIKSAKIFPNRRAPARANVPTAMAVQLLEIWNARGYALDVVLYRKYGGSTYVDPHEREKVPFKDLPNRFPSVLSLDFLVDEHSYENFENLFAMYVLYNLGKYRVSVNEDTKLLEIDRSKSAMSYREAVELATEDARSDTRNFLRRQPFRAKGTRIGDEGARSPTFAVTHGAKQNRRP